MKDESHLSPERKSVLAKFRANREAGRTPQPRNPNLLPNGERRPESTPKPKKP